LPRASDWVVFPRGACPGGGGFLHAILDMVETSLEAGMVVPSESLAAWIALRAAR
jgi:hypothetical protein